MEDSGGEIGVMSAGGTWRYNRNKEKGGVTFVSDLHFSTGGGVGGYCCWGISDPGPLLFFRVIKLGKKFMW